MKKPHFDERQILARGQAYKYGFWAGILYFFLASIALMKESLNFTAEEAMLWGAVIMVVVFLAVAIWKDAYFKVNDQGTLGGGFLVAMGVSNLIRHGFEHAFAVFLAGSMLLLGTLIFLRRFLDYRTEKE